MIEKNALGPLILKKIFERLMDLNRRYHYSFIALVEPFREPSQIDKYKIKLGFSHAGVTMKKFGTFGEKSGKMPFCLIPFNRLQ